MTSGRTTRAGVARTLGERTVRDSLDDRVTGLAAEVAFFALLSIPPLLLVFLGALGYVAEAVGPETAQEWRDSIVDAASNVLTPETVDDTVAPLVDSLLARGRADILSIGAVIGLWSASRATKVVIGAVTIAYDQPRQRAVWHRRGLAIGLTAGAIVSSVIIFPLLVAGPRLLEGIGRRAGLGGISDVVAAAIYWPVVVALTLAALTTLFHVAPPIRTPWRRDVPGALLALVIWIAGAAGLRAYSVWIASSDTTYGPFAAPIVVLLWLYVTSLAVLLGAELNAEIEKEWPTNEQLAGISTT